MSLIGIGINAPITYWLLYRSRPKSLAAAWLEVGVCVAIGLLIQLCCYVLRLP